MPKTTKKVSQLPDDAAWMQLPEENGLWYGRFTEYLKLGYKRSVRAVYCAERGLEHSQSVPQSWSDAYKNFAWQARAKAYDDWRRREVFERGNAADTERVKKLDATIEKLYVRVEKMLENAPEDEKFNGFLLDRLFAAMELIAKHTGGLTERREVTGKDGGPVEVEGTVKTIFYLPELDALPEQLLDDPKEGQSDAEQNP